MAHKTWLFTLCDYTEAECEAITKWDVERIAVTKESTADGTPYLRGVVVWNTPQRLGALTRILPDAYWDPPGKPAQDFWPAESNSWLITNALPEDSLFDILSMGTSFETENSRDMYPITFQLSAS